MHLHDSVEEPASDYSQSKQKSKADPDHVDAINQMFAEFEFAYHNQFHKAFQTQESLVIAKKYWLSSLEAYAPVQILLAAKRVISSQDYLPSIAAFIRACDEGAELFGLVSTHQAYLEACSAPSPKIDFSWSHEAVYLAGKAAGWYFLANESESLALPVYRYHYERLCQRVIKGETLEIDMPTPIADKVEQKLSATETKQRIAKMRQELGL